MSLPTENQRPHPYMILQSDGAARGNPGPASYGAVAMDPETGEIFCMGRAIGSTTNNVAEYQGIVEALRMAHQFGARRILLEADSELLIKQLMGTYKVRAEHLKPLYEESVKLLNALEGYELRHIPREQNTMADQLANRALDVQRRTARRSRRT